MKQKCKEEFHQKKQPKPQYEELLSFVYITQIPQV